MKKSKKFIFGPVVILILMSIVFSFNFVLAADNGEEEEGGMMGKVHKVGKEAFEYEATETTAAEIAGTIANAFFSILGIIFIFLTIYGGYLWLTARGDEDKVKKAKDVIKNSIIGLIITLFVGVVANFVFNALGYGV